MNRPPKKNKPYENNIPNVPMYTEEYVKLGWTHRLHWYFRGLCVAMFASPPKYAVMGVPLDRSKGKPFPLRLAWNKETPQTPGIEEQQNQHGDKATKP